MAQSLALSSFAPQELPALALVFGLALAEPLNDDDALLLASFISTISSNIVLFVTQRSNLESAQPTGATGATGATGPVPTAPEEPTGPPPTEPIVIPRGPRVRGAGAQGAFGAQ